MTYSTEYDAQVTALHALISSVPDVGRVHDRPRAGDAETHWMTTISGVPEIRAWEIVLAPDAVNVERREQGRRHRYRTWQIVGYVGLRDTTEIVEGGDQITPMDQDLGASWHVINRLAGEIADAIDATEDLSGTMINHFPVDIPAPDVVTIGGNHLCWGVTLSVTGYTIVE